MPCIRHLDLISEYALRVPVSSPAPAADCGGCSSVGRAPGCGPGCRGFNSHHSPHDYPRPLHGPRLAAAFFMLQPGDPLPRRLQADGPAPRMRQRHVRSLCPVGAPKGQAQDQPLQGETIRKNGQAEGLILGRHKTCPYRMPEPTLTAPWPVPQALAFPFRILYASIISCAPVAQLDRAPDFESVGRPFESGRAYQFSL